MKPTLAASSTAEAVQPRSSFALWLGMLGPPLLWLTQFEANYALAGGTPGGPRHLALLAIGALSLALMAVLGLSSWRQMRLAAASPLDRESGVVARVRFMGVVGVMLAALFFLVTAAQAIAAWFFQPGA